MQTTKAQVKVEREFNNYLVPLFQFGMFSNEDMEIHPGPLMTFNGRVHSNRKYLCSAKYKISRSRNDGRRICPGCDWRSGDTERRQAEIIKFMFEVNGIDVQSTVGNGSVKGDFALVGGPKFSEAIRTARLFSGQSERSCQFELGIGIGKSADSRKNQTVSADRF